MSITNEDYVREIKTKIRRQFIALTTTTFLLTLIIWLTASYWAYSCAAQSKPDYNCPAIENPITTGDVFAVIGLLSAAYYFVVAPKDGIKFPTSFKRDWSEKIVFAGGLFYFCAIILNTVDAAYRPYASAPRPEPDAFWQNISFNPTQTLTSANGLFQLSDYKIIYFALAIYATAAFATTLLHFIYESELYAPINAELRLLEYSKNLKKIRTNERNKTAKTLAEQEQFRPTKYIVAFDIIGKVVAAAIAMILTAIILSFFATQQDTTTYVVVTVSVLYFLLGYLGFSCRVKEYSFNIVFLSPLVLAFAWILYLQITNASGSYLALISITLAINAICYVLASLLTYHLAVPSSSWPIIKKRQFIQGPLGLFLITYKQAVAIYNAREKMLNLERHLHDDVENGLMDQSRIAEVEREDVKALSFLNKFKKRPRCILNRINRHSQSIGTFKQVRDTLPELENQLNKLSNRQSETSKELRKTQIQLANLSKMIRSQSKE